MRISILFVLLAASVARAGEFRAGAAAVKITPPLGVPMAGYYYARAAESVHDDLYARAIVIQKDQITAALVVLDLISTTRGIVQEARKQVEARTGIPGANVMISATHAHTGPVLAGRTRRDESGGGAEDLVGKYSAELPGRIAEAVALAHAALKPAKLSAAIGREDSIAFNRRYHMKDGTVGWNPGKGNPAIIKPAGPIDPDVPLVCFDTPKGQAIATYVSHAVHLDNVGGLEISADVPYTVTRLLADVRGADAVTLYATGCCGDVNHVDVNWPAAQKGHANAARMGAIIAAEVFRTMPMLREIESDAIACRSESVKLPLPKLDASDVEKAREIAQRVKTAKTRAETPTFNEQVNAFKVLDVAARNGQPHDVEVQVIAIGKEIAFVALPGEIFAELGLSIKQDSPFRCTIVAELANGSVGYVPSARSWPQGAYEVNSARCAIGSGEMLAASAVKLLNQIHAEK